MLRRDNMKVLARPRGTNKTKQLIEDALRADAQILTTNKRALAQKIKAYGLSELPLLELSDLFYGNYDKEKPLFIHKIEDVMSDYFKSDFNLNLTEVSVAIEDKEN
jgi:hypothetical protein